MLITPDVDTGVGSMIGMHDEQADRISKSFDHANRRQITLTTRSQIDNHIKDDYLILSPTGAPPFGAVIAAHRQLQLPVSLEQTMSEHRYPKCNVTNNQQPDNNIQFNPYRRFQPGEALEAMCTEVAGLEAFAFAANEALERVTRPQRPDEQREFDRLCTYVRKTASLAVALADLGERFLADLGRPMRDDTPST